MPGILDLLLGGNTDETSQLKWYQNFLSNLMNTGTASKQFGQDTLLQGKDDLYNRLLPFLDNTGQNTDKNRQLLNGLLGDQFQAGSQYNPFDHYANDPSAMGINSDMKGALDKQGQYGDAQGNLGGLAGQVFSGGGWSQAGQNVFDNLDQFRSGGNQRMGNMAEAIINGGGANPYSNFTVDKGTESLNRGGKTSQSGALENFSQQGLASKGMTPWDQMALGAAQNGLATQGFNSNSNALSNSGQGLLANQGRDANNQYMTSRGQGILGKDPLLSMEDVTGMAADKAASLFANNSEQNYKQAMKRGGGPAVRSGLQNQAVQENENEALRGVGDAITNARMQQQGLQLNQFGQGKDLMSAGMSDRMNQQGLGGQLTGQGEQAALQRMLALTGLGNSSSDRSLNAQQLYGNMMAQSGNLANQDMATVGGLGMQGLNAANQKLGMGINLQGQTSQADLQALQQYMANLGGMNQYALGAGNLSNGAYTGAGNTANSQFGNNLAGNQFGFNRQQAQLGGFNQNLDRLGNINNQQNNTMLEGFKPLQNTQNQGFNMYNNATGGLLGLFGGYGTAKGTNGAPGGIGSGIAGDIAGIYAGS